MSILRDIINGIFNNTTNPTKTMNTNNINTSGIVNPILPDKNVKLAISKVAAQINFAERAYGRPLWPEGHPRMDVLHDLELMLANSDMESITLELHAGDHIAHEFVWSFTGQALIVAKGFDLARGIELPLLDLKRITGHRFLVSRRDRATVFRHLLKLSWTDAAHLAHESGGQFASEHATAITGGRVSGTVRVSDSARHTIMITTAGVKEFAFGKDLTLGGERVYLNKRHAPPQFCFQIGRKISAVIVSTPRGLQARDIRAAA